MKAHSEGKRTLKEVDPVFLAQVQREAQLINIKHISIFIAIGILLFCIIMLIMEIYS